MSEQSISTAREYGAEEVPRLKALIIESSRVYQVFLAQLYEDLGYQPVVANFMEEALAYLGRESFEIVCMNMYYDGGNTIEYLDEIRELSPHVAILMLTSEKNDNLRDKALRAGVTELINKTSMQGVVAAVSAFVKQHMLPQFDDSRVLYIEDSKTQAAIISKTLKALGLQVDCYATAEAGIKAFRKSAYDLVITDVLLRGENSGLTLVRQIRSTPGVRSRVPILTITGFDDLARRMELLRAGTNDYITKPVVKEELAIRVTNLINNKLLADKVVRQQAKLYELAVTDQLTKCYNRHGFKEFTDKYLANAMRRQEPVGLLMIDLDHFKRINDTYGHDVGDQVLRAVGKFLIDECRTDDLVARFGGEEFIVFLPNCSKSSSLILARRLRKNLEALEPAGISVTCSIGATFIPPSNDMDLEAAFEVADRAVYRAKKRGRNTVSFRKMPHA